MLQYDISINHCTLIDEEGTITHNQSIAIKDGLIAYVGPKVQDANKVIDGKNKVISPSFANGHAHSPMNMLKGLAEDVNIDAWFNQEIWPYESSLIPEDVKTGAKLGIYEMINNGISVFAEHYFMEDEILKAVSETGIRIDLAPTIFSGDDFDSRIEATLALNKHYQNDPNISISWGPHSTYMCTPDDLEIIGNLANKHQMKIHLHIGETEQQFKEHKEKHQETPMQTLDRVGVLDQALIMAHSLHFDQDDLKLLKEKHFVALCPITYMKLAMNFDLFLENSSDFNWGFGTDGAASSAGMNVLDQARLLGLYTKYFHKDAEVMQLENLWKQIMNTHTAFNFKSGVLKEGYAADLIIWDLNQVNTLPNHNLLASILYSADARNIESVLIKGEFVKENHQVQGFDSTFIETINQQKERLLKAGKSKSTLEF